MEPSLPVSARKEKRRTDGRSTTLQVRHRDLPRKEDLVETTGRKENCVQAYHNKRSRKYVKVEVPGKLESFILSERLLDKRIQELAQVRKN